MIDRVIDAFQYMAEHFQFLFNWLLSPIEFDILGNHYSLGAPVYLLIGGSIVVLVGLFAWKIVVG